MSGLITGNNRFSMDPYFSGKNKHFYFNYNDQIYYKRYNSAYWLRRYAHRRIYEQILSHLQPGQNVLDAGCGEGVLVCLAAKRGIEMVGLDISSANLQRAAKLSTEWHINTTFIQGDAENLPFPDNSFDVVISSHVLEHLPNFQKGLSELYRVTRTRALIGLPTCLNPACWVLLGKDDYWRLSRRSLVALPLGLVKIIKALVRGEQGPDENYGGQEDLTHIWRFPWIMKRQLKSGGFVIEHFEAGPLIIPYFMEYLPKLRYLQPHIDLYCNYPIMNNLGYGSLALCVKQ